MKLIRTLVRALQSKSSEGMDALEARIGYRFKDRQLLELALTHRSRGGRQVSNEKLELLGDAVLGLVAVEHLLEEFPLENEGTLTKRRSYLVSKRHLARAARGIELSRFMLLGKGERAAGVAKLPSVRANTVEAVVGAVYVDGGLQAARRVVLRTILRGDGLDAWETASPKSTLQELVQRTGGAPPVYVVVGEHGPPGRKTFEVEVRVAGECWGRGTGRSKKQAQRAAAEAALEKHGEA